MRLTTIMMTALFAIRALQGQVAPRQERSVTVCMEHGSGFVPSYEAQGLASKIFASIGVTINWHFGLQSCPPQAIQITLSQDTPKFQHPRAYAYALPYEGTRIVVYYDRIVEYHQKPLVRIVLAHVLVHEITHVLEGMSRHSDSGMMKARWDGADFAEMARKPLHFAPIDIRLIYAGMAERAAQATTGRLDPALAAP